MLTALLELSFRPDDLDEAMASLYEVLEGTRAFPGCEHVEALVDVTDVTRVVVIERFASAQDDEAYRVWRAGDGRTGLGRMLAAPAKLARFDSAPGL